MIKCKEVVSSQSIKIVLFFFFFFFGKVAISLSGDLVLPSDAAVIFLLLKS